MKKTASMSLKKAVLLIVIILLIDQISKIYVKTHFVINEEVPVFEWFRIVFIENDGMAWGAKIPGKYGKLILTTFRLFAIVGIGYWLWDVVRKRHPRIIILAVALIFAGAFGNVIDSVFYGVIFNDSYSQVATLFPAEGGYGTLFHGKVVDMFHFPLFEGDFPDWFPFWGGDRFTFFDPVFNVADSSITVGVILLLISMLFGKKFRKKEEVAEAEVH